MSAIIHLVQLKKAAVEQKGSVAPADLDLGEDDELVHGDCPLEYSYKAELHGDELLVEGSLSLSLHCECARCLNPFLHTIEISPWSCLLQIEGDDSVVVAGDSIDLTPFMRDDLLLEFPQHPLCRKDCPGLKPDFNRGQAARAEVSEEPSVWGRLNDLKL